jgi:hypothetical protein
MHMRSHESRFELSKWYLDCVSTDGDAFIGYAATLRYRALRLHYSSSLRHRSSRSTQVTTSLKKYAAPFADSGGSLHWTSRPLKVEGTWEAAALPIARKLFESGSGSIQWNCLLPRARCRMNFGNQECLEGLGYAEHLTLSIPPWELPITELRWGRYLSENDALVWIDWRGPIPLSQIFHNGLPIAGVQVTDHGLHLGSKGPILSFEERRVLREGPLIRTALAAIPGIQKLFPMQSLRMYECKWLSRGILKAQGRQSGTGWAVHEVVRFGPETAPDRIPVVD